MIHVNYRVYDGPTNDDFEKQKKDFLKEKERTNEFEEKQEERINDIKFCLNCVIFILILVTAIAVFSLLKQFSIV